MASHAGSSSISGGSPSKSPQSSLQSGRVNSSRDGGRRPHPPPHGQSAQLQQRSHHRRGTASSGGSRSRSGTSQARLPQALAEPPLGAGAYLLLEGPHELLLDLEAVGLAPHVLGGQEGGTAPRNRVDDHIAGVGEHLDEPFQQGHGLLGRVHLRGLAVLLPVEAVHDHVALAIRADVAELRQLVAVEHQPVLAAASTTRILALSTWAEKFFLNTRGM